MTADPLTSGADTQLHEVTAMFCDLVGSTELSTVLDSEDFSDALRSYHDAVADAVASFGGSVNQIAGDGVLVLFGYPRADEAAAEQAIRASFSIFEAITDLGLDLQVRIGLHSGPCVVRSLRPGSPQGTLALGETLNTAARVQSAASPGQLLISEATYRLVAGWFDVESAGLHQLKGLPAPVELFHVLGPSAARSRLDARGRNGFSRFVGRHAERAELGHLWHLACDGHGQVALISGEPGIGKSRLARVLADDICERHRWLEGSCSPFTVNTAFQPIIGLLERFLDFTTDLTADERMERLAEAAERMGLAAEPTALVAALLSLPSVPASMAATLDRLGPEARRERTLDGLVAWVVALSSIQPVVLVIEDLHWCDSSTLELLRRVIEASTESRLLTLLTARPEFQPPWSTHPRVHMVPLARITDEESEAIVDHLAELPLNTALEIVRRADGVPLFVEELTAMIAESRLDSYAQNGALVDVPPTLHGSLLARLDRLGTAKQTAQIASVIGRVFTRDLVASVQGEGDRGSGDSLDEALSQLVEAGLVQVGTTPDSFTFKHALVQDVAYQSLLKKPRATFHARVLEIFRARFPERLITEPEVAARHAEAAGLSSDAVTLFQSAAIQAIRRSAHEEAIAHLRRAIAVVAGMSPGAARDGYDVDLHRALAGSLIQSVGYNHPDTMSTWQQLSELASQANDPDSYGGALLGLGVGTYCDGRLEESLGRIEHALASALSRQHVAHTIAAHNEYATVLYGMARFDEALAHATDAIALYDPALHHQPIVELLGDDSGVSAMGTAGWSLATVGLLDQGLAANNRAVATAEAIGHRFSIMQARLWRVAALLDLSSADAASEAAATLAYAEEQGLSVWAGHARSLAGYAINDYHLALAGAKASSGSGLVMFAPWSVHNIAELQLTTGRLDQALATVDYGFSISRTTNQPFYDSRLGVVKADALVAIATRDGTPDRFAEAENSYRHAIATARTQGAKTYELIASVRFGRYLTTHGRGAEAHEMLRPLYDSFTEGFETPRLREAAELLTEIERGSVLL